MDGYLAVTLRVDPLPPLRPFCTRACANGLLEVCGQPLRLGTLLDSDVPKLTKPCRRDSRLRTRWLPVLVNAKGADTRQPETEGQPLDQHIR